MTITPWCSIERPGLLALKTRTRKFVTSNLASRHIVPRLVLALIRCACARETVAAGTLPEPIEPTLRIRYQHEQATLRHQRTAYFAGRIGELSRAAVAFAFMGCDSLRRRAQ